MTKPLRLLALTLVFFGAFLGCNSISKVSHSDTSPSSGLETIAILGTNDLHGTLTPLSLKSREKPGVKPTEYSAGGLAMLASYIRKVRSEFGSRFIWLDAGDEFQGSIESNLEFGAPMVKFFNTANLTAAAIGNHEFDFGVNQLKDRMREAKYPYLAANILDKSSKELADFPNTKPSILVSAGQLKVGIMGLSTVDTPKQTRLQNVKDYTFENLKIAALREAQSLREKGAQVVLLTAHAGLKCEASPLSSHQMIRSPSDVQGECLEQHEVVKLLRSLPSGTIDAVIAGHTHHVVHHWVAGVPVIQGGAMGRYFNLIYLTYDWNQKKILPQETRIEGPVPVCEKVFKNQNDCNGDRKAPKIGRGPLVPVKFHHETLFPDPAVSAAVSPIIEKTKLFKNKKIGIAARPIEHSLLTESELGNLTADAIRDAVQADFGLMNTGGIRAPLEAGPITYDSIFRTIPFDNVIATLKVTAKELGMILQVAENGIRGFFSVSGLKIRLIDPSFAAPFADINGNGQPEPWEINRLLDVRLSNGRPLDSDKLYTLATLDFLVSGGDDLGWPMSQVATDRVNLDSGILVRDALIKHIEKGGQLNSEAAPLVSHKEPRLTFDKPPKAPSKKHHRKRKRNTAGYAKLGV